MQRLRHLVGKFLQAAGPRPVVPASPPEPAKDEQPRPAAISELRQRIAEQFDEHQLRDLCHSLYVEYDSLPGTTQAGKARELITYLTRHGHLGELFSAVTQQRPDLIQDRVPGGGIQQSTVHVEQLPRAQGPAQKPDLENLEQLIHDNFAEEELKTLCFDLGVDYEDLPGAGKAAKVKELIFHFSKRGIGELVEALSRMHPTVPWATPEAELREHYGLPALAELRWMMAEQLNADQVRHLCVSMQVDYDALPGLDLWDRTKALVLYLAEQRRIAELVSACTQSRLDLPWQSVLEPASEPAQAHEANSTQTPDPRKIAQLLIQCFDLTELQELCFDVGVDYEDLPGAGKVNKVGELAFRLAHRKPGIPRLVQVCSRLRPAAPWAAPGARPYEPYSQAALVKLRRTLIEHLSLSELAGIFDSLNVTYAPRSGEEAIAVREAISYLARRERLHELLAACAQRRPEIEWRKILEHGRGQEPAPGANAQQASSVSPTGPLKVDRAELHKALVTHFTVAQLRDLCFELGIDYDSLPAEEKAGKARELVVRLERKGRLAELAQAVSSSGAALQP